MAASRKAPKKDKNEHEAHIVQDALIPSMDSNAKLWVIDSGASFHATSNGEMLQNYVASDIEKVLLGDDEPCNIVGKVMWRSRLRESSGI